MVTPGDPTARIAALERALQRQKAASRELEQIVEDRTRELYLAMERIKRQARLVGARTAIALLAQYGNLERAAPRMLEAFGEELGWQLAHLLMIDTTTETMRCRVKWQASTINLSDGLGIESFAVDVGLPGRVWATAKPEWITELTSAANFPRRDAARAAGLRSACAFPIIVDGSVHAIIEMFSAEPRELDEDLLITFGALGGQIGHFIEQARAKEQVRVKELQIARQIQTSILPRDLDVAGLEVAATMMPASDVGGDYFDVLPFAGGAWFGIGDVTGHGVAAGMIMLMVQSAVGALTRDASRESPRDVVVELNSFLYDNIHRRLRDRDHVTFTLLRYTRDGVIRFAGAHEDIIIWRANQQRCEVVETEGAWLGAVPSIESVTTNKQLKLEPGDILVLYTDGLTEARNGHREQFGLDRLCEVVAELANTSPPPPMAQMCEAILAHGQRWCSMQEDDISLVIARYHAE